jgi:hypothetical protein
LDDSRLEIAFSRSTVDEVAATVGHDDATGSRRAFLKIVGLGSHVLAGIEESRQAIVAGDNHSKGSASGYVFITFDE